MRYKKNILLRCSYSQRPPIELFDRNPAMYPRHFEEAKDTHLGNIEHVHIYIYTYIHINIWTYYLSYSLLTN